MKTLLLLLLPFFCASVSCTHKRNGEIIKTKEGKFYMLKEATSNESYYLIEIDTSQINHLSK